MRTRGLTAAATCAVVPAGGTATVLSDTDRDGNPELYVGGNGDDGFRGRVWTLAMVG